MEEYPVQSPKDTSVLTTKQRGAPKIGPKDEWLTPAEVVKPTQSAGFVWWNLPSTAALDQTPIYQGGSDLAVFALLFGSGSAF